MPYWKHALAWFLLSSAIAGPGTTVAMIFGYSGKYTPELLTACIVIGVVGGILSYVRAQKKSLDNTAPVVARSSSSRQKGGDLYEDWTKAQKFRSAINGIVIAALFTIIDLTMTSVMEHNFPNIESRIAAVINVSMSLPIAALLGLCIYKTVIVRMFPDSMN